MSAQHIYILYRSTATWPSGAVPAFHRKPTQTLTTIEQWRGAMRATAELIWSIVVVTILVHVPRDKCISTSRSPRNRISLFPNPLASCDHETTTAIQLSRLNPPYTIINSENRKAGKEFVTFFSIVLMYWRRHGRTYTCTYMNSTQPPLTSR